MKHILLLVNLIMQVSRTILRNVTKKQNLTMDVNNTMVRLKRIGPKQLLNGAVTSMIIAEQQ